METKELIESLRGFALGLKGAGHIAGAEIVNAGADRLEELEKKYATAVEMAATATEIAATARKVDGDLVRRSDVLKYPLRRDTCDKKNANPHFINGIESVMEYVETLSTVDAEPVIRAHWTRDNRCSACGEKPCYDECEYHKGKRCPKCGAHMDDEVADG